ncbi:MAG: hypothetical protein K2F65_06345 [Eubacterium sp.]|nr:hypothetical protein [Eubacterium sp.]
MKKSLLLILAGVLFILGITGCSANKADVNETNGVSMVIKKGTLTNKSATIVIHDSNETGTYMYGESFRIDKKENENWNEAEIIYDDYAFNTIGYIIEKNGELELECDWEHIYGSLEKGEYRLVKDAIPDSVNPITDADKVLYLSVEFTIE